MRSQKKSYLPNKNIVAVSLFALLLIAVFGFAFLGRSVMQVEASGLGQNIEASELDENIEVSELDQTIEASELEQTVEVSGLNQLEANQLFVIDTFDTIGDNFTVLISGTCTAAKTAEPELYDSMLSQGRDLLPAVLSLLANNWQGKRGAELAMLCNDILESLGEPILDFSTPYAFSDDFVSLYETYLGSPLPGNTGETSPDGSLDDTVGVGQPYVWWEEADPSVYIPEPDNADNPPPDFIRWEPMLGCYIYRDAYYSEELGMIVLEQFPASL
ncbi:MAG: hypothetical protein FWG43_06265 [Clostridiales bacterium]|nr:hypothetical protein [Clostridiales bacterium]